MTDTTVRVIGLDTYARTVRKAQGDLSDLKDAHRAAGDIVARDAAVRAPRRSGALAGTLRSSRQARRAQVLAGRSSVPYAGPIHWGWPARNIGAQPFMSEAARATEPQWVAAYLSDMTRAVDKIRGA